MAKDFLETLNYSGFKSYSGFKILIFFIFILLLGAKMLEENGIRV